MSERLVPLPVHWTVHITVVQPEVDVYCFCTYIVTGKGRPLEKGIGCKFNKDQDGKYTGTIREKDFAKLQMLLRQTNCANLQDSFKMPLVSDMPSIMLHIPHEGKVKTSYDYGWKGTPQLEALYTFLTDLYTNQEWRTKTFMKEKVHQRA